MPRNEKIFKWITLQWTIFFLMIIAKYAYYGYTYYPIVDDNNQYGVYFHTWNTISNIFKVLILENSTVYSTRPIAGLLDVYFWGRFWECLGIAFFIITILHFVVCILIYLIFKKLNINLGFITFVLFGFLPFGSEATYWISASTRIIIGMLFVLLSVYFLYKYIENQNKYVFLFLMFIFNLISMGFYEQIISWGFLMIVLVFIMCWNKLKQKWIIVIPIINNLFIAIWYKIFSNSTSSSNRIGLVKEEYIKHIWNVNKRIYQLFYVNIKDLVKLGFIKSTNIIIHDKAYMFFVCIILLGIIFCICLINQKADKKSYSNIILKFVIGITLFVGSYIPFYFLDQIWICNRNLFISFIGIGIILDAILDLLGDKRILHIFKGVFVSGLAVFLLISNVYELRYYKTVYEIDNKIVDGFLQLARKEEVNKPVLIVSPEKSYIQTISPRIGICIGSNWSLKGAINSRYPNYHVSDIVTISKRQWGYTKITPGEVLTSLIMTMEDNAAIAKLMPTKFDNDRINLMDIKGDVVGEIQFISNNDAIIK